MARAQTQETEGLGFRAWSMTCRLCDPGKSQKLSKLVPFIYNVGKNPAPSLTGLRFHYLEALFFG